ncbi:hypothetical protein SLS53_001327 [Cytospora paraplurivora]|uniref:Myocyte-specific enhancer factor 2d n=1 Tax=Cytospora paraplurivora TaxID=2898453 RepID=A0AAN9UK95_9PEZI
MPVPSRSGAMIREIPGFYYDEEKQRYFKIESGSTAPSTAAWSIDSVKKRKAEKELAKQQKKRQERTKDLIKRSSALAHPQTGGRLVREFGIVDPELPVESWAAGLRERGEIRFVMHRRSDDRPNISCMIINGDDEASGLGAAYATPDIHHVIGKYIPTDKNDQINFAITDEMRASNLGDMRAEAIHLDEITSMAYHKSSNSVIIAALSPSGSNGAIQSQVCIFHPRPSEGLIEDRDSLWYYRQEFGGRKPAWLLGACEHRLLFTSPVRGLTINSVRTFSKSPPGHLDGLLATSHGIMRLDGDNGTEDLRWVTPEVLGRNYNHNMPRHVFSVDYHPSSPGHVFYAGCRDGRIHRIDMRVPLRHDSDWDWWRHRSAVAHVRCLDDNQILAAGPINAMAIYDVRWGSRRGPRSGGNSAQEASQPVVRFPGYKNNAHVKIGLDVTHDVGGVGGLGCGGVVAAGLDDGTVGVFSLRTGRRLGAGDVDDARKLRATAGGVVKAIQFEKMPWERETSLFVGVGDVVKKFSFGVDDDEEEW